MYCSNCGKEIKDKEAIVCIHCGRFIANNVQQIQSPQEVDQSVSVVWVVLSVFFPIVGILYWASNIKTRPKCAKICVIAAIISWVGSYIIGYLIRMLAY